MLIETRMLTSTPNAYVMTFNKKKLEAIAFKAGEYTVSYEEDKIVIHKKAELKME
jgi:hypothetical protein